MRADYQSVTQSEFAGYVSRLDATDVQPPNCLLALNSEYVPGSVRTRTGFAKVWNPNEFVLSMANWISSLGNFLVYFSVGAGGTLKLVTDLTAPFATDLYTQNATGAIISTAGPRAYITTYDGNGLGVGAAHVVGKYSGTYAADKCFLGPLTTVPTLTEPGAGVATAGLHRVGYVIQTRSGFIGKICPTDSNGNLTAATITSSGSKNIHFSLTATWPTEAATVFPVMTPVSNLNRYFIVPTLSAAVTGGGSSTVTFDISISDDDLLSGSVVNEVTDHQFLFTQTPGGTDPFSPFATGSYGPRQWYLTEINNQSQAYMSDPDDPQHITADQHVLYLPGFRQMKAGFSLDGLWVCLGPHWTFTFRDNGDVPVTWGVPTLVDANIGAFGPKCISVNGSQGFAFVAHETGFWVYSNGSFSPRPLTYYIEPDWKRINWTGGGINVQVIDDKDSQRVYVLAPLDSATTNSHIFMFDYQNGLTSQQIQPSLWDLANAGSSLLFSGCIVQNPTTDQLEFWMGVGGNATKVLRQMAPTEANPFNDDAAGIDWQWEGALWPNIDGTVYYHYIQQLRATGAGSLYGTVYGMDRTVNTPWLTPLTLGTAPGHIYIKRFPRVRSEAASLRLTNNKTANAYGIISEVKHYYSPGPSYR